MGMRVTLLFFMFTVFVFNPAKTEIKIYEKTDNTGINKFERIGVIEKYLMGLAEELTKLDQSINKNNEKINGLEASLNTFKTVDLKVIQEKIEGKTKDSKKDSDVDEIKLINQELEKLKQDILTLKNEDIEKLQVQLTGLKFNVDNLQKVLKINSK